MNGSNENKRPEVRILRQFFALLVLSAIVFAAACRRENREYVTVALPDVFSSLDTLTTTASDSAAERVRNLIFNSLVRKDSNFDYVGELASQIDTSPDGLVITFTLRDGVKFHNGKELTSADVKYTFDELFNSNGYKSGAFFDTVNEQRVAHITAIEVPNAKTVIFKIARPELRNQLLSNLVTIPIIPEGSVGTIKTQPIGSGPFKFVNFDSGQNTVEFEANTEYWEGSPKFSKLLVKTVTDASAMQAELQRGSVDIAPLPSNLPPDALKALGNEANLKVEQFEGSNIQYLGLNTQSAPLNNKKIRQAIGYAIDREKIIRELLLDQAKIANSILPQASWAYSDGTVYRYDPEKAKQLLKEAGYKDEPIKFKYSSGNAAFNQYAQAIQSSLTAVGLNVQIETIDPNALREQLANGQFQLNTGVWIGGNQDPIFFRDLFTTERIPGGAIKCCNRGRYSNPEVDALVKQAIESKDRETARQLYGRAWTLISDDLPLLPLWYPANMVISNKRIGNIKISASGDWSFVKDITVN